MMPLSTQFWALTLFCKEGWASSSWRFGLSPSRCPSPRQLSYRWALLAKNQRLTQEEEKKKNKFPPILEKKSTSLSELSWIQKNKIWYFFCFALRTELCALNASQRLCQADNRTWVSREKTLFAVDLKDFWWEVQLESSEEQIGKDLILVWLRRETSLSPLMAAVSFCLE